LAALLKLKPSTLEEPELACNSEGWKLGMLGTLTLLQIRTRYLKYTYILDVLALSGRAMFDVEGAKGQT